MTATRLNVRPTPSTAKPPLTQLVKGTRVTITDEQAGWYAIDRGWIASRYVELDPVLMVDLYWDDLPTAPKWEKLAALPAYVGAILKATQGTRYPKATWFVSNWPRVRSAGVTRYGDTWFRGAYHYLVFNGTGRKQADFFLDTIDKAGGWDRGDLYPIVDVERGKEGGVNDLASRQQVIDDVSAWIERVKQRSGRKVILYGRGAMRDLGIRSKMGADFLWNPSYTRAMRPTEAIGWPATSVPLWQYTDGKVNLTKYPTKVPGFGAVDASVFRGGHIDDLLRTLVGA